MILSSRVVDSGSWDEEEGRQNREKASRISDSWAEVRPCWRASLEGLGGDVVGVVVGGSLAEGRARFRGGILRVWCENSGKCDVQSRDSLLDCGIKM